MTDWSGFTDEDLQNLKGQPSRKRPTDPRPKVRPHDGEVTERAAMAGRGRNRATPPRGKKTTRVQFSDPIETVQPISANQMLSQPVSQPPGSVPKTKGQQATAGEETQKQKEVKAEQPKEEVVEKPDPVKEMQELSEDEGVSRELGDFDKFQKQQKVMEEQNKMKKKLLASAIQERKKKAKAEASRLVRIQHELDKLDHMLNADVAIIRDRIEESSREYLEAQKRFEIAEKEYVEAKMDLFHKQEEKESLTEHLCTIIHQNELRKGKKLLELMEKLDMEASTEEMAVDMNIPSAVLLESVKAPKSPPALDKQHSEEKKLIPTDSSPKETHNNEKTVKPSDNVSNNTDKVCDKTLPDNTVSSEDQKPNEKSDEVDNNAKSLDENKNVEQSTPVKEVANEGGNIDNGNEATVTKTEESQKDQTQQQANGVAS